MKEITKSIWDFEKTSNTVILITTNGYIKRNGEAVLGRGVARQAVLRFPEIPEILGRLIAVEGNIIHPLIKRGPEQADLFSFPVKHNWWEPADLGLIKCSALQLAEMARKSTEKVFILPRPGCGNGRRDWEGEIKPIVCALPDNVWLISQNTTTGKAAQ